MNVLNSEVIGAFVAQWVEDSVGFRSNGAQSRSVFDCGCWCDEDPEMHQGLAHYLEHMLFLGTEKYPEAGNNSLFSNRGGYTNAYTAGDHTNYHFEIDPEHLDGALDRFAQFFTAPLFIHSIWNESGALLILNTPRIFPTIFEDSSKSASRPMFLDIPCRNSVQVICKPLDSPHAMM